MRVYAFLGGMWALMILGGGLAVLVLGPLDLGGDAYWINAPVKAVAALLMVAAWVYILTRVQRYML